CSECFGLCRKERHHQRGQVNDTSNGQSFCRCTEHCARFTHHRGSCNHLSRNPTNRAALGCTTIPKVCPSRTKAAPLSKVVHRRILINCCEKQSPRVGCVHVDQY